NSQRLVVTDVVELSRLDTVALKALRAAEAAPSGDQLRITLQDPKQDLLVVAQKEYRPNSRPIVGAQSLEDLRGAGPAVDQVANEDQQHFVQGLLLLLRVDLGEEFFEEIEASVNVA